MKKKIITCAAVIACIISAVLNQPNLQTIKAAAEIKEGAHIGYVHVVREINYDVYFLGE